MKSTAQFADRPLHPILVLLPAGCFLATLVFDIGYAATANSLWWLATIPSILVGVAGGVVAAVPGVADYVTVARRQGAGPVGLAHGILNLLLVALFAINVWLRLEAALPPAPGILYLGLWLTILGNLLLLASVWLGATMVYTYHVGVLEHPEARDHGAHGAGGEPRSDVAAT